MAGTIADKLVLLNTNKRNIKAAIEEKVGETIGGNMSTWASKIASIAAASGITGHTLTINSTTGNYKQALIIIYSDGRYLYTSPSSSGTSISYNDVIAVVYGYLPGGTWTGSTTVMSYSQNDSNCGIMFLDNDKSFSVVAEIAVVVGPCFIEDTLIELADGTKKKVQDVSYDDNLLVWDFEAECFAFSKPAWIKVEQVTDYKFVNRFGSGAVLETTGKSDTGWGHRGYNLSRNSFTYFPQSVGDVFATRNGCDRLIESSMIDGSFKYYNIITKKHLNLFSEGVLTSCSLNNGFGEFDGMKFKKLPNVTRDVSLLQEEVSVLADDLNLSYSTMRDEEIISYVKKLKTTMKDR